MTEIEEQEHPAGEDAAKAPPTQRRVGSVRDAIAIMRFLASPKNVMGVNGIARALDLSPSSCFNLLKTMTEEQFVSFDKTSKQYALGPGAVSLAQRALDPIGAYALLRQRLENLADKHQVTASLLRPWGGEYNVVVGFAEGQAALRIHLATGRLPIATGAGGRCALAFSKLDKAAMRQAFDAVEWGDKPSFKTYLQEVELARKNRWAMDIDQYMRGVTTVASPCVSAEQNAEFIVTATMFSGQHSRRRLEVIAEDLRTQTDWLATHLAT